MKKLFVITLAAAVLWLSAAVSADAQKGYVPAKENIEAREAFEDMRFGVFIHWGIYSMFAQGEWYLNSGINAQEYAKAAGGFYPASFNAREWVRAIKASGAKYITFTSRHHDGFSMFDTAASEYDIIDATPFKRDVIAELAQACKEEGIALHFYYSLIDWTREDYPSGRTGLKTGRSGDAKDYEGYRQFMKDQLTELLTKYGKVGAIWFDGHWDHDSDEVTFEWRYDDIYPHIHNIDPSCLIGNNHHITPIEGEDFQMFERDLPGQNTTGWADEQTVSSLPLEMCQTMNGMWGYKVADQNYKSVGELVQLLVKAVSMNSNLLMNVGPQPDGNLPAAAVERLEGMGRWMGIYGDSVYGATASGLPVQEWGVTTRKGNTIYLHVFDPSSGKVSIPLKDYMLATGKRPKRLKIKSVTAMNGGSSLAYQYGKDEMLTVTLPPAATAPDYVIEVRL